MERKTKNVLELFLSLGTVFTMTTGCAQDMEAASEGCTAIRYVSAPRRRLAEAPKSGNETIIINQSQQVVSGFGYAAPVVYATPRVAPVVYTAGVYATPTVVPVYTPAPAFYCNSGMYPTPYAPRVYRGCNRGSFDGYGRQGSVNYGPGSSGQPFTGYGRQGSVNYGPGSSGQPFTGYGRQSSVNYGPGSSGQPFTGYGRQSSVNYGPRSSGRSFNGYGRQGQYIRSGRHR